MQVFASQEEASQLIKHQPRLTYKGLHLLSRRGSNCTQSPVHNLKKNLSSSHTRTFQHSPGRGSRGGADWSFISSSTLQPVGLVRCSLAGTNAHLQGRKTTCAVERPRNGPMRCKGYDDITMMSQPEIPGEKAISKTSPTKKTPA